MSLIADVDAMKNIPLFSEVKNEHLQFIAFISEKKILNAGEEIIREGEKADNAKIILKGRIEIKKNKGEILQFFVKQKPILLGDIALFTETDYRFSVRATEKTTVMELKRNDMLRLMREFPQCGAQIYRVMRHRFQNMMGDLEKLGMILQG